VGVLDGIHVLDFGRFVTGPYCAALLGDMGADVVRVERLAGGEDRFLGPVADDDSGAFYLQVNRNKRGVALDVSAPEAPSVIERLVRWADVLVANLPPAGLKKLGLDEDTVRAIKPDIVLTTIDAFGTQGPYAGRVGFDGIAQVFSGSAYLSGTEDGPSKSYAPWADFSTAAFAALGTLAALLWRKDHAQGQHVEASLLRTALTVTGGSLIEQAVRAVDRGPVGNRSYGSAPSDIVPAKDGWILVQVIGPVQFRRWTNLVGRPEWLEDPRFVTDESRVSHATILNARLAEWCSTRTATEALAELEAAAIPCAPVLKPQEVLDDPHVQASGILTPTTYSSTVAPLPMAPFTLSHDSPAIRRPAPTLGEHTVEVLHEVGCPPDQIERLAANGAIRPRSC
jgi:crotonobetainyl-CoA:carnitine CoA-transferase CaiB-like acyl-CoA transferase